MILKVQTGKLEVISKELIENKKQNGSRKQNRIRQNDRAGVEGDLFLVDINCAYTSLC